MPIQVRQVLVWRVEDSAGVPVISFREVLPPDARMPVLPVVGEKVRFHANGRSFEANVTDNYLEYVVDGLNNIECSAWLKAKEI
ncbi:MAG: hypothetical protein K2Y29_10990 [Beijerinckiaceae bacterium]|nr:hypothetical protein [Beijerinckiaceae bacterium]